MFTELEKKVLVIDPDINQDKLSKSRFNVEVHAFGLEKGLPYMLREKLYAEQNKKIDK